MERANQLGRTGQRLGRAKHGLARAGQRLGGAKHGLARTKQRLGDFLLAREPSEIVAVDFGEASVRVLHVVRRKARLEIVSYGAKSLIVNRAALGESYWSTVGKELRELVQRHSLAGKPCWICMPGKDIQLKQLTLPRMPGRETRKALELEWKKSVSVPSWKGRTAFEKVQSDGSRGSTEILSAMTEETGIQACLSAVRSTGLVVERVTSPALAYRALAPTGKSAEAEGLEAILDIGSSTSHMCVFRGRKLILYRELSIGGKNFSDALTRIVVPAGPDLVFGFEEAEELKKKFGVPSAGEPAQTRDRVEGDGEVQSESGRGDQTDEESLTPERVLVMIRPVLERLLREIWSSVEYSGEELMGGAVQTIYLSGGGARLKGLAEHMRSVFKIDIEPVSTLVKGLRPTIESDGSIPWELYAPCLGLALVGYDGIDMAEASSVDTARKSLRKVRLASAVSLGLAVALGGMLGAHQYENRWQATLAQQADELGQLSQVKQEMTELHEALQAQEIVRSSIRQVCGATVLWSKVIVDLSTRIGSEVLLTGMRVEVSEAPGASEPLSPRLVLTGYMKTSHRRLEEVLAEMMASLSTSPLLTDIQLIRSDAAGRDAAGFTITCGLAGG